jgi:hypothetical protein
LRSSKSASNLTFNLTWDSLHGFKKWGKTPAFPLERKEVKNTMTLKFKKEKETKNTVRFQEVPEEGKPPSSEHSIYRSGLQEKQTQSTSPSKKNKPTEEFPVN